MIVTSYVFRDGQIDFDRLKKLKELIGKEHLVGLKPLAMTATTTHWLAFAGT